MGKGTFLGEFEQMVLLAVMRLDGNAYGVTIRDDIEARTDREVVLGAVYAALDRLERKGHLKSTVSGPEPIRGGRSRKLFRITPGGRRALVHSREMMERMAEGLAVQPPRRA